MRILMSKEAFRFIMEAEVSSEATYNRLFTHPTLPGQDSGITIGIGYDLGFNTEAEIMNDWGSLVSVPVLDFLISVSGLKKDAARNALTTSAKAVTIPFDAAWTVFTTRTIPRFVNLAASIYQIDRLNPHAAGAIVSLVYNRGASLVGDRRREMKELQPLIADTDLVGIAGKIREMKRIWPGNDGKGLRNRRENEAVFVQKIWDNSQEAIGFIIP